MRRTWIGVCLVLGCGSSDTVPAAPSGTPAGAELARSALARETEPQVTDAQRASFAQDNQAFAFDMYRELAADGGNLFFSPYSVSSALAMACAGARGETAQELESALHFSLGQAQLHPVFNATAYALARRAEDVQSGDGFRLSLVNQAWGQKGHRFLDSYLDVLAQHYGAGLFLLDFGAAERARGTINGWVADQTERRIQDLLPAGAIDGGVVLVLTNAIYFKASWLTPFAASETSPAAFHAEAGERTLDMMHLSLEAQYAEQDGYRLLRLPYASPDVSMLLLLPPEGQLTAATGALDAQRFAALRGALSSYSVTLSLPRWQLESGRRLREPLQALGVHAAFAAGQADFSGMDGGRGLYVDEVYHKAFIAVDEQGTEAAAATAVVTKHLSLMPSVKLAFDRPFVFAVMDEPTGQLLFLGQLADPAQ